MIKSNVVFAQFVNSVMASERVTHSDAWLRATELKPDLNTLMLALGATRARVELLNERQQGKHSQSSPASRIDARNEFHAKVHAYMDEYKVDYDAAHRACQRQFSNDSIHTPAYDAAKAGQTSGQPGLLALFGLPDQTDEATWQAAFKANGNQSETIHWAKVFDGLVNYFMEKKAISHDMAIEFCKGTFPILWTQVKELAKS